MMEDEKDLQKQSNQEGENIQEGLIHQEVQNTQEVQNSQTEPLVKETDAKHKKKHGCLITLLIAVVVLALAAVGFYFFMPGLRKPNDLGVKASQEAYDSAIVKLTAGSHNSGDAEASETVTATETVTVTETAGEEYSSSYKATEVSAALTSEEITSLLTINRPADYPLQETQVRLNEDDSMEVSSNVSVDFLLEDILDNEITKEEIADAVPLLKDLPEDVNVYLKLNADVEGNEVETFDLQSISVMGVSLPDSMIGTEDAGGFITDSINSYLENKAQETGERYDSLKIQDGNLIIDGAINLP